MEGCASLQKEQRSPPFGRAREPANECHQLHSATSNMVRLRIFKPLVAVLINNYRSKEELENVEITHEEPKTKADKVNLQEIYKLCCHWLPTASLLLCEKLAGHVRLVLWLLFGQTVWQPG